MAVLASAEVLGMTSEMYEGLVAQLSESLRSSPGFVLHAGLPGKGSWRVVEVWASRAEYDSWYDTHVKPNLPPGMEPTIEVTEVHSVVVP